MTSQLSGQLEFSCSFLDRPLFIDLVTYKVIAWHCPTNQAARGPVVKMIKVISLLLLCGGGDPTSPLFPSLIYLHFTNDISAEEFHQNQIYFSNISQYFVKCFKIFLKLLSMQKRKVNQGLTV